MTRARFYVKAENFRPLTWPIKHPYWHSGTRLSDDAAILVAYADDEAEILRLWPEASEISNEPAASYAFTDRFPKPTWFVDPLS